MSFENEIKNKIEESKQKNNCTIKDCYIINKNLLLKIKVLFSYNNEFEKFINNCKLLPNNEINKNNLNEMKNK